jgi:hypothetical protein
MRQTPITPEVVRHYTASKNPRVTALVCTSVDDLRSSLVHYHHDDIPVLNEALEACVDTDQMTKQNMIERRLRELGHFVMCHSCGRVKCHPGLDLCHGCKQVICARCMDNAALNHNVNGAHALLRAAKNGGRK